MALTDVKIRNTKPAEKQVKLFDSDGLFLLVAPSGGKLWRLKYRYDGKEKTLALGVYPEISLADARERRDKARKQLANGIDPMAVKKAQRAAKVASKENSFEVVAREWHKKFSAHWATSHAVTTISRLQRDVFPWVGACPINEVKASAILMALRRVEGRGALESARRLRIICGQVFRYAVATGRAERDPTADLRGALPPVKERHLAAIIDPVQAGGLLRAIDSYKGAFVTQCALRLAPLLFVRPGELRQAEWAEIDFEAAEWNIPGHKMKMKEPHLVPLSKQAVEILKELQPLTSISRYVFPSVRTPQRPMSGSAILAALRRMGYTTDEMTGHGFRAMARTILDEVLQVRPDFIEHQLSHAVRDPNGRAYNRTAHLAERRKMMQQWSDYLDKLKAGAMVIPFRAVNNEH